MKIEQTRPWVEEEIQYLDKDDYLEAYKKLQEKERFSESSFDDFDREQAFLAEMVVKQKFKGLFNWVKKLKFVDMINIYKQFFALEDNIVANWKEMSSFSVKLLNERFMSYEDATPYVYLQDLILGRKSDSAIRHVFIDEAQDYSPFQFAFIKRLFPYSKVTLLGDINQAIYSGVTNSQTVLVESVSEEETETIVLTKTYRSTKPIVEFTRGLIENGDKIEPFNRSGEKPTIKVVSDQSELEINLIDKVKHLQQKGHKTIAIICKTAKESKDAFDLFCSNFPVRLIEKGTLQYEEGILIIPSYLAKGIEFDSVIIYDAAQYSRDEERKLFYTACTRAMHELHLFSLVKTSPLLNLIPQETFDII